MCKIACEILVIWNFLHAQIYALILFQTRRLEDSWTSRESLSVETVAYVYFISQNFLSFFCH